MDWKNGARTAGLFLLIATLIKACSDYGDPQAADKGLFAALGAAFIEVLTGIVGAVYGLCAGLLTASGAALAQSGFHASAFALALIWGFILAVLVKAVGAGIGWYADLYRAAWPPGDTVRLPILVCWKKEWEMAFKAGQLACLLPLLPIVPHESFIGGLLPAGIGYVAAVALPVMPEPVFCLLACLDVDHQAVRARLLPPTIEEGAIVRLSVRPNGAIASAVFRTAYRGVADGTDLFAMQALDLAQVLGALRVLDGHTRDADLVESFLDQRFADWREQAAAAAREAEEAEARARAEAEARARAEAAAPSLEMSRGEALAWLDVREGATRAEMHAAYKRLIARNHPDAGGSNFIAQRLNRAKELLLK